ncbi:MAG: hypothetical protein QXD11_02375 [Candidatus Micrarchaeaceae archaeon]
MSRRTLGLLGSRSRNLARHHKPSALAVKDFIKKFEIGDKVAIIPKGNGKNIPHPRYKGKIGTILEKRGSSYVVEVRDMNAKKKLVVPSVHLEKVAKDEASAGKAKASV